MLTEKQAALASELAGDHSDQYDAKMEAEDSEYQRRGIYMCALHEDTDHPHLFNFDEDNFRSNRFLFLFDKPLTVFGPDDDIQLDSLSLDPNHCSVRRDDTTEGGDEGDQGACVCTLVGGDGDDVFHNGRKIGAGQESVLAVNDRVVIANEMMMFRHPGMPPPDEPAMSAEDAKNEYRQGVRAAQAAGGGGGGNMGDMEEQMRKFQEEKAAFEKQKSDGGGGGGGLGSTAEAAQFTTEQAYAAMDKLLLDMAPKVKACQTQVVRAPTHTISTQTLVV
jgi:hypothetical protein